MKCADDPDWYEAGKSPSMRREWIEIRHSTGIGTVCGSSPSMRREWIEMIIPRCGLCLMRLSPSIRREWIEIPDRKKCCGLAVGLPPYGGSGLKCFSPVKMNAFRNVSLHTEGVD